jgi:deoxyxylulose-5-phosphate synthase
MPDEAIKPALYAALRANEIGNASPYAISFAQKANSGGSFGAMQGDLAAGQPVVRQTFRQALIAAGVAQATIDDLVRRLSQKGIKPNVITADETKTIDAALFAGRKLVDAMDAAIMQTVYGHLDTCIKGAADAQRSIDPIVQLYIALWINMTGPPTTLLSWLGGPNDPPPALAATVVEADIQGYLLKQTYYVNNPGNWPHMVQSVGVGAKQLPQIGAPLNLLS